MGLLGEKMTIVYILLVINFLLGVFIVHVINEADMTSNQQFNTVTRNQVAVAKQITELTEKLEELSRK